ncbi:MoxR family ATPase [Nitriliruptoria bacterium AS10]|nr:MoxR family ATPase [Salsipaludibacter albus]
MRQEAYLADRGLATAVSLALRLGRPLLLEGDAGVGKTEVAKVLARILDVELIRLQCHEGIDASQALYDWDYPRQLMALRAMEALGAAPDGSVEHAAEGASLDEVSDRLYTERFLLERPLLRALRSGGRAVLLIDEIDRADDEFEAFLLEILSDFQVSIPELGTIATATPPVVVLTSNRTRDLHEALRRRALYHWIDHPDAATETEIIRVRAPEVPAGLARSVADVVVRLRQLDLFKPPGVAETLDWARALTLLDVSALDRDVLVDTLSALVKDHDDLARVRADLDRVLGG